MYKHGFGDVNGEHWLGLEQLHAMTSSGRHELLVLMEDFEGNTAYALYDEFKIASEEEKYKLTVGNFSGTAGDSLKGWTAEGEATADMPTVMEAIINAMIDFRKEILDNLQLSLEYHTEQLEEIKIYVEHKMEEQEKRIKESLEYHTEQLEEIKAYVEHKMEEQEKRMKNENELNFKEMLLKFQQLDKTLDTVNLRTLYGGSWTVFQRRIDGSVDFFRNWTMYKHGFGDVNGEHWLGLEQLHIMTSSGRHELLVLVEDFEGNSAYALYDEFKIASEEEKYKLTVGKYSGTVGDSLDYHNGSKFSTFDQDNDADDDNNCAKDFQGAWWFEYSLKSYVYHM
ncbi:fibrinogen-like protein 1 [Anopheles ziemanni]|uniref:fibrinogen-like protein 1 n=1 Tax=Anopheles ziemanni TaxID=345580 RepID=UPI00265E2D60|nr:fibrinogen-like protein 1 [Anopheles ziemanni]